MVTQEQIDAKVEQQVALVLGQHVIGQIHAEARAAAAESDKMELMAKIAELSQAGE